MAWMYFALGSVLLFTCMSLLQKVMAMESKNPQAMAVAFNGTAIFMAWTFFLISGSWKHFTFPPSGIAWIFLLIATVGYGLYERLRFPINQSMEASLYATVSNISVIVAFVSALFIYQESLSIFKILGLVAVLSALVIVSYTPKLESHQGKNIISRKTLFIALLAQFVLGIAWSLDKKGTMYLSPDTYSIFLWTLPIVIIAFPGVRIADIKAEFKKSSWKIPFLAFFNVAGYLLQLKALAMAQATLVIPIVQSYTLATVLCGIILLHERTHIPRKIIAGIIAFFGVTLLVAS